MDISYKKYSVLYLEKNKHIHHRILSPNSSIVFEFYAQELLLCSLNTQKTIRFTYRQRKYCTVNNLFIYLFIYLFITMQGGLIFARASGGTGGW